MSTTTPNAYRARDLGQNQIAWLRRKGWIDARRVTRLTDAERRPVVAGSDYLNLPLRTEAEVLSLLAIRQAREPRVERPCDTEPSGDAA